MATERKYYSQVSGSLLRSRKKLALNNGDGSSGILEYKPRVRAFKSAQAYNKLLTMKHANKVQTAMAMGADSTDGTPSTSHKPRHTTPKVSFKCDIVERESDIGVGEPDSVVSTKPPPPTPLKPPSTQHITAVRVTKREIKQTGNPS